MSAALHHAEHLQGVHPDLVRVVLRAMGIVPFDVLVIEGCRTLAEEQHDIEGGASALSDPKRSRHLDGHAVDLGCMPNGDLSWDWPYYAKLAEAMGQAAALEGVQIEWGGNWATLKDGTHFQLPWSAYPSSTPARTGA